MSSEPQKKRLFLNDHFSWRHLFLVFLMVGLVAIAMIVGGYRSYPFLSFDDLYGDLSFLPTNRQWRWDEQWTFITPSKLAPKDAYILEGAKAIRSQYIRCDFIRQCAIKLSVIFYAGDRNASVTKYIPVGKYISMPDSAITEAESYQGECMPPSQRTSEYKYWCQVAFKHGNYVIEVEAELQENDDISIDEFWTLVGQLDLQTFNALETKKLSMPRSFANFFSINDEPWEKLRAEGRR